MTIAFAGDVFCDLSHRISQLSGIQISRHRARFVAGLIGDESALYSAANNRAHAMRSDRRVLRRLASAARWIVLFGISPAPTLIHLSSQMRLPTNGEKGVSDRHHATRHG